MGNKTSTHVQETPLAPQRRFPRVINTRFVLEHVTTLRMPFGFWSHTHTTPLAIVDEEMNVTIFQIGVIKDSDATRLLLDKNGVPVVTLEGYPVGKDYATYVPRIPMPIGLANRAASVGEAKSVWHERHALCYLQTNTRPLEKRLLIELEDPVTRTPINIRVEGLWQNHEALFWLDRGLKRDRECIARVYIEPEIKQRMRKKNRKAAELVEETETPLSYCVGIAPGVDIAMIVLACAAMDEALATKESKQEVVIATDEISTMLAQRHHGTGDRDKWRSSTLVTAT